MAGGHFPKNKLPPALHLSDKVLSAWLKDGAQSHPVKSPDSCCLLIAFTTRVLDQLMSAPLHRPLSTTWPCQLVTLP